MTDITVEYFLKQDSFTGYCLQSNPDDIAVWETYIREHPENRVVIEQAKTLFFQGRYLVMAEKWKPAAVAAMQQYLYNNRIVEMPERKRTAGIFRWVAAAVIVLVLAGVWWISRQQSFEEEDRLAHHHPAAKPVFLFDRTGRQRQMVELQDGSFVLLDSGAVLRVDSAFGVMERRLFLSGTAWFKVKKDVEHPFRVVTGKYQTTALGTAFRIHTESGYRTVKVELEEGKVAVHRQTGNGYELITTLSQAQSIALHDANTTIPVRETFSIHQLKAWKASEIVFRDAPLAEVLEQLQLYYDVTITVEDKGLLSQTFNGKFNNDQLSAVLDMVCFSINRQYRFTDNNHVLIY